MKPDLESLLPKTTGSFINKILLIEVYFLLRSGESPAYFSLTDFAENYSLELIYISVTLSLLSGWMIALVYPVYYLTIGSLTWLAASSIGLIKISGVPVFKALRHEKKAKSVSISVAKDYAKENNIEDLAQRIDRHERSNAEQLANETISAANFFLVATIASISYFGDAPNFLMKVASFSDRVTSGKSYLICLTLLLIQGILGRISSFHLIRDSGSLPPDFFKSEEERKSVADWVSAMIDRQAPLANQWSNKG